MSGKRRNQRTAKSVLRLIRPRVDQLPSAAGLAGRVPGVGIEVMVRCGGGGDRHGDAHGVAALRIGAGVVADDVRDVLEEGEGVVLVVSVRDRDI